MEKIMIATLYSYEPIIAGVMAMGAKKLYLLMDESPDEYQKKSLKEVKERLSEFVNITEVKTNVYNILMTSKACVDLIDSIENNSKIILNISAARKTKALGLLYAGYARFNRIDKIVYITKEEKEVIELPKLSFNLNKKQKELLQFLEKNKVVNIYEVVNTISCSRANAYRHISELRKCGYIKENALELTEAGKIAIL